MEAPETQNLTAETAATAAPAVAESASPAAAPTPEQESAFMNDFLRGMSGGPSLNQTADPDGGDDSDEAGESAAATAADVSTADPSDPAKPLGRRAAKAAEAAKALADAKAEAEALRAQLAERDPEKIREQIRQQDAAEREQSALNAQAASDAERYRKLIATPDHMLTAEDYTWREERKDLLLKYPDVQQHYEGVIQAERKAIATEHQSMQQAFWADVYRQLEPTLSLPGLSDETKAALKQAPWPEQIRLHRAAERALAEADSAAIRKELDEYKRNALGAVQVPSPAGMPSGTGGHTSENDLMNGFFRSMANGTPAPR